MMWIWRCISWPIQHFLNYFEGLIDTLEVPFLQNVTTQEHILPISLESDDFDKELLTDPETLRELVKNYKRKKLNFDKLQETLEPEDDLEKETSIFSHIASKIFIFVMALILLIVAIIVIMLLFQGAKMQALITNLAIQKSVKTLTEGTEICSNYEYWIIITWLSLILLGIMFLIIEKVHKMPIFRKHPYLIQLRYWYSYQISDHMFQLNYAKLQVAYICLN